MGKSSENHGKTWEILGQSHGGVDSSENLPQIEDIPDIPAGYVRFYTRGYHCFLFSIGLMRAKIFFLGSGVVMRCPADACLKGYNMDGKSWKMRPRSRHFICCEFTVIFRAICPNSETHFASHYESYILPLFPIKSSIFLDKDHDTRSEIGWPR